MSAAGSGANSEDQVRILLHVSAAGSADLSLDVLIGVAVDKATAAPPKSTPNGKESAHTQGGASSPKGTPTAAVAAMPTAILVAPRTENTPAPPPRAVEKDGRGGGRTAQAAARAGAPASDGCACFRKEKRYSDPCSLPIPSHPILAMLFNARRHYSSNITPPHHSPQSRPIPTPSNPIPPQPNQTQRTDRYASRRTHL